MLSQQCYVDYTDPSELEFPAVGGYEDVYFSTYPTNCIPDPICPSWINWTRIGLHEVRFYCSQNESGQTRYGMIYVGDEGLWISVSQLAGLTAGIISGNQTICYGGDPTIITSSSAAGGGTTPYTYSWEKSTDDGYNWSSVGVSTLTYDPSSLTETTQYRRKVTDTNNYLAYTNIITKTVWGPLTGGTISEDQTIPYNGSGSQLTNSAAAGGGSGSSSYQWQKSVYNGGSWAEWTTIIGATGATYDPPQQTFTARYIRSVSDNNGCGIAYSNTVTISILGLIQPDKSKNSISVYEPLSIIQDTGEVITTVVSRIGVKYFDGLGRPSQEVAVASNGDIDLVVPHTYDQYGRKSVNYLPVPVTGNSGQFVDNIIMQHETYYNSTFSDVNGYSVTVFENSPLNRVLKQGAPGATWQPSETGNDHSLKYDYRANSQHEVLFWKIVNDTCKNSGGEDLSGRSYYPSGTLYKTITKDENWDLQYPLLHSTEEFRNMLGQVVLKRGYVANGSTVDSLDTYYVYDDFGLLRYVLSPEASSNLGSTTVLDKDHALIKGLCYYYEYDGRKRMVEKQIPGADPVYLVYDKRDRLVLVQDGNFRKESPKKWLFTKYDMLNRPVLTGVFIHNNDTTRVEMQLEVDVLYSGSSPRKAYVERNSANYQHLGYENESFPNSTNDGSVDYYTAIYYDSYDFPDTTSFDENNNISDYEDTDRQLRYNDRIKGHVTGSKALVMGTSTFITTTIYYDNKYRPIQTIRDLYLYGNTAKEVSGTRYDFVGNPIQVRQKHIPGTGDPTTIDTYFTYDNYGRLLTTENELNETSARHLISANTYNEVGQLVSKGLHMVSNNFLQEIDYRYNIRGWLTRINDPENLGNDMFAMRLFYNDTNPVSPLTRKAQYNGNISGITWNRQTEESSSDTLKSTYSYLYDGLNRISNSYYGEDTGSGLTAMQKFREYDYRYDLNGNILGMKRTGNTGSLIDSLIYDYGQSLLYSNRLLKVTDGSLAVAGFTDGTNQGDDYEYDSNGNLLKDLNKGISSITYNFLNLPELITTTGGTIRFYYDATGRKVRKVVTEGANTTTRSYEGGFEYENGVLVMIHTGEGFIQKIGTIFTYNYFLKDHLGNTRIVFSTGTGETLTFEQSTDYYPFGLVHEGGFGEGYSKYQYNGKEMQEEFSLGWYDYGARFYDPQIGRWNVPDPLSELFFDQNPYHYVSNNPLNFMDPTGMAQVETSYGMVEGKLVYWDGYGSDEGEKGEKKKGQDPDPPKKGEKRKTDRELWAMAGEFYASAYSITGGGYAAAMDGRDPFNPTQADEDEAGDALFKAVLFIGGEYVASKAFTLLKHFLKAVRSSSYAAKGGMKAIEAGNYTFTKTAAKHLSSRPYMDSPSTITNIMKSGKGVPDATFKGGMNYKVPGTFNGSQGVWELGINPQTNTIYHFLFKTVK